MSRAIVAVNGSLVGRSSPRFGLASSPDALVYRQRNTYPISFVQGLHEEPRASGLVSHIHVVLLQDNAKGIDSNGKNHLNLPKLVSRTTDHSVPLASATSSKLCTVSGSTNEPPDFSSLKIWPRAPAFEASLTIQPCS